MDNISYPAAYAGKGEQSAAPIVRGSALDENL
jgi:hypothetical protein